MLSVFGFGFLSGFYLCDFSVFCRSALLRFRLLGNYSAIEFFRPLG